MVDFKALDEQAERNVPYPKIEPVHAAMTGFVIAALATAIFVLIAGIDTHGRVFWAMCVIGVGGYVGPFIYFKNQSDRHYRERERLFQIAKEREERLKRPAANSPSTDGSDAMP